MNLSDVKTILISHLHGDHFADIPFFMFNKFFNHINEKTIIYCPKGTFNKVKSLFITLFPEDFEKVYPESHVEFKEFDQLENEEVEENIFVTSFEVDHGNCKPAYGFIIRKENQTIGISGDSKQCTSIEQIVEKSDISILDISFIEGGKNAHMSIPDLEELFQKYPYKKIIPTHMHDDTKMAIKKLSIEGLIVLEDGDYYEI